MTINQLQTLIKQQHQRMVEDWGKHESQEQRTLFRAIKLMEEMGELCEEILCFSTKQRKGKNREMDKQKLAEELADVIIVALLIGENLGVDTLKAMEDKLEIVKKRHKESR